MVGMVSFTIFELKFVVNVFDCLEHGFPSKTFHIINRDSSNDSSVKRCKRRL